MGAAGRTYHGERVDVIVTHVGQYALRLTESPSAAALAAALAAEQLAEGVAAASGRRVPHGATAGVSTRACRGSERGHAHGVRDHLLPLRRRSRAR